MMIRRVLNLYLLFSYVELCFSTNYHCDPTLECGCSSQPAIVTKIVGGENAQVNSWNWAVTLLLNNTGLCGGSIISSRWVLTAAHCLEYLRPENILVIGGSHLLENGQQRSYGSQIIIHPQYGTTSVIFDIGLIRLATPFNMSNPTLARICLPTNRTDDYPPINSTVNKSEIIKLYFLTVIDI